MKSYIKRYWCFISVLILFVGTVKAQDVGFNDLSYEELQSLYRIFFNENSEMDIEEGVEYRLSSPIRRVIEFSDDFRHNVVYSTSQTYSQCVLILVQEEIYNALPAKVQRYAQDLYFSFATDVVIETISNENYIQVKNILFQYYTNHNMTSAMIIGDVDYALFEQTYAGTYATWPCDLYYMDMDGIWADYDEDGIYDAHEGNRLPEIFVGRVPIGNGDGNIELLSKYLDKNHKFWLGEIPIREKYSLGYTNEDWVSFSQFQDISVLFGANNYIKCHYGDNTFGKNDYQQRIISGQYEFIQLAAHSCPYYHRFIGSTYLYADTIAKLSTPAIAYNLFCCSACDWRDKISSPKSYLAGAYLLNNGNTLSIIGSTKTGSMLNFIHFYSSLSQGNSIGTAYKEWWQNIRQTYGSQQEYIVYWFYGMTIIGDPFVSMKYNSNTTCPAILNLTSFDNSNTSDLHYYRASQRIEVGNNYVIPIGKHVIFEAPDVDFSHGFQCPLGASFETRSDGCKCNHLTIQ